MKKQAPFSVKRKIFIVFFLVAAIPLSSVGLRMMGFGHSSIGNELIGQVKKVNSFTPIICPNWYGGDISLGVIQNGVGSYSNRDIWVTIPPDLVAEFQKAVESGQLVKIHYDEWRLAYCTETAWVTNIEFLPIK